MKWRRLECSTHGHPGVLPAAREPRSVGLHRRRAPRLPSVVCRHQYSFFFLLGRLRTRRSGALPAVWRLNMTACPVIEDKPPHARGGSVKSFVKAGCAESSGAPRASGHRWEQGCLAQCGICEDLACKRKVLSKVSVVEVIVPQRGRQAGRLRGRSTPRLLIG